LTSKKILKYISSISGEPESHHSLFHSLIRMDTPDDVKNKLAWHQDFVSSEKVMDHPSGLVAWIPLVKVDSKNGSMEICLNSHKEFNAKKMIVKKRDNDKNSSEYIEIPLSTINKFPQLTVVAEPGDVIIMPMSLIHQSGINSSDSVRFVAIGRYYPITAEDFLPGKREYVLSKSINK